MNFKSYLNSLNIADWFSVARIILFLPLLVFIFTDERLIFTWLLLIAFLTDAIDGILARRLKIVTKRGAHLDSVGDRLTLLAAFLGVWFFGPSIRGSTRWIDLGIFRIQPAEFAKLIMVIIMAKSMVSTFILLTKPLK